MRRTCWVLLAIGPVLLLSSACTGSAESNDAGTQPTSASTTGPSDFSPELRHALVEACVSDGRSRYGITEDLLRRTCECPVARLEQQFSDTEMREIRARVGRGEASDAELDAIAHSADDCGKIFVTSGNAEPLAR